MNYRIIVYMMGHILRLEAVFMVPAFIIAAVKHETNSQIGFAVSIAVILVVSLFCIGPKKMKKEIYPRDGFVLTALSWIALSVFGALPFFISGEIPSLVDCFFETVSGFTTTGASVFTDVASLDMSLLYWRSFIHWLGGMGVLVFLLAIVPTASGSGYSLNIYRAEAPGPEVGKMMPRVRETAKALYKIYIVMTLVLIVLYIAGGMPVFDSFCNAFSTAGTGGFSIKNDSFISYSPYAQTVTAIFMILFGVNFQVYYFLIIKEFARAIFNEELRVYAGILVASITMIALDILPEFGSILKSLHHALFQVASIITTTGFATTNYDQWPEFSRALLVVLTVVGACAGSTGGGMKISRLMLLCKAAWRDLHSVLQPRSVKAVRLNGSPVSDSTIRGVYIYMSTYMVICIAAMLLMSIDNFSFESNFSAVLACINNVGPGLDMVGPLGNYSAYSPMSKLILSFVMLAGRLEIFPMLLILMPATWRK